MLFLDSLIRNNLQEIIDSCPVFKSETVKHGDNCFLSISVLRVVPSSRVQFAPSTNKTYALSIQFKARRDTRFRSRDFIGKYRVRYSVVFDRKLRW